LKERRKNRAGGASLKPGGKAGGRGEAGKIFQGDDREVLPTGDGKIFQGEAREVLPTGDGKVFQGEAPELPQAGDGKIFQGEARDILRAGVEALGIACGIDTIEKFMLYLSELKKWSRVHNLTSIRDDRDIVEKHFLDSLLYLRALPQGGLKLLDVGSGAGFPGIPLKLVRPEVDLYLLEPRGKKAAFLRYIADTLGLGDATVIEGRLEDLKPSADAPPFDAAVVRALFGVTEFIEKVSPAVRPGGVIVLSKGPEYFKELEQLDEAYRKRIKVTISDIPAANITRYLISIVNIL
jgi:16S rRNA (guanine527-N7)-methyltransferase